MIAISLDSELDGLSLNEVREQKLFDSVDIVLARVKTEDREFLYMHIQFFFSNSTLNLL